MFAKTLFYGLAVFFALAVCSSPLQAIEGESAEGDSAAASPAVRPTAPPAEIYRFRPSGSAPGRRPPPPPVSPRGYDDVSGPSEDYLRAEAGRVRAIREQVELNERGRNWVLQSPESTTYSYRPPASLEYIYGVGDVRYFAGGRFGHGWSTPWAYVPGDVWGYPHRGTVAQPSGHLELQTGPNRWEYRPVYPPDSPTIREELGLSPPATWGPSIEPAIPARPAPGVPVPSGPREF